MPFKFYFCSFANVLEKSELGSYQKRKGRWVPSKLAGMWQLGETGIAWGPLLTEYLLLQTIAWETIKSTMSYWVSKLLLLQLFSPPPPTPYCSYSYEMILLCFGLRPHISVTYSHSFFEMTSLGLYINLMSWVSWNKRLTWPVTGARETVPCIISANKHWL